MAFEKGKSGNPGGRTKAQIASQRELARLTPRAIARLGNLIDSENEAVALAASKEVLDRYMGKARQQTTVDITHEIGPALAHAKALDVLTRLPAPDLNPLDNPNPLISLDNVTASNKLSINHGVIEDAEVVSIEPEIGTNDRETGGN